MKVNMNVDVRHLTRVEGHGNIHIEVKDGALVQARWEVVETPRFFEAMLRGVSHNDAPVLTSRICGICSIGHTLASLRAVEQAMGITIPKTALKLRLLAKHGETLQSHFLHLFFLAAPDFLNAGSVAPLMESHPELMAGVIRLRGMANTLCDLIAGRTTHPVSLVVGGVSKAPEKARLMDLRKAIEQRMEDAMAGFEFFKTVTIPDFTRETEFVSLKGDNKYPWIGGDLISSDGVIKGERDYLAMTNEYKVDFSTSKFTKLSRDSFAVGALARINNNHLFLRDQAKDIAHALGLEPVSHNPFMQNAAQLAECFHVMEDSIEIINELLDGSMDEIRTDYEVRSGEGVGAVEVPRGILFHHYVIDDKGLITKANCIIPTTQNNANIHYDLNALVAQETGKGTESPDITRLCEMLVRAYDPCISCSVH
ncbi:MAG: Ni/Fe hydrogenase subunit alpha [Nitrospirae bacterium CG_4_9_14_3_um_filter_53_35]|nr:MAG: hydrogenase [Nitrospirae bacterium CG2_30_53_67]PIS37955.1 MAG: Ni/Fe hydrogenase subunit alpha [Nitrospirae bacterium CG08_land_8_20_14_0_20_52_24]PIV82585.1 MAG: Ni/Fe hydrogenase subunit alpha [Nitrospirae bacterium CG17_big_fil_post_rev_8_21_14_2_50_50_9]PIW84491.1 MAG: Ni/Fe hydrogenase subunit alpha [Nitrospirae bacterium CG_4_8_14_3_um_filter_50_41]PIX85121.1 MAG: Ni/Fe hydrogenase subunit alpha [Nitrospirae bacterium CG_4_10_14_3_um_filter_53_41]PJA77410.1 MAG: Ni/Fe hydrogenas